jgi:hypothetical protein
MAKKIIEKKAQGLTAKNTKKVGSVKVVQVKEGKGNKYKNIYCTRVAGATPGRPVIHAEYNLAEELEDLDENFPIKLDDTLQTPRIIFNPDDEKNKLYDLNFDTYKPTPSELEVLQ